MSRPHGRVSPLRGVLAVSTVCCGPRGSADLETEGQTDSMENKH